MRTFSFFCYFYGGMQKGQSWSEDFEMTVKVKFGRLTLYFGMSTAFR